MLAIRLQRTGRKGHAQYRVVVQDKRRTPTSGRIVAYLGAYNPHTKTTTLKKEQAELYLKNGAQPSERVAKILKSEGIKLPKWVVLSKPIKRATRNPEKLRKDQPDTPAEEASKETTEEIVVEAKAEEKPAETQQEEAPAEQAAEAKTEEAKEAEASADTEKTKES